MKKNWIYLFLLMAIAVMPLTSCDKDDGSMNDKPKVEDPHDPISDADQVPVKAFDALEYLQGSLVVVDANNEVVRRVYGKPLDESQPTVISVPVADYAAAEETFLGWVAPDKEATKVDGGYDYTLTDANGVAQGSVSFRAVAGEGGLLARMSVAPGTDLKQVSEVNFVDSDLWPENITYSSFVRGNVYILDDYSLRWTTDETIWDNIFGVESQWDFQGRDFQKLPFYCIQGNTQGKDAILVWLSPDADNVGVHPYVDDYVDSEAYKYLPSVSEAEKVLEVFNRMDESSWKYMLSKMDKLGFQWSPQWGRHTTGNSEFLLNSTSEHPFWLTLIKCLDLDSHPGKIVDIKASSPLRYRYMQIVIIPASRWELLI